MTDSSHASRNQPTAQICDLVRGIARPLADKPDDIRVEPANGEAETVIRLSVHEDDLGTFLGKNGRTARSLRTIVGAAGTRLQARYTLDIRALE